MNDHIKIYIQPSIYRYMIHYIYCTDKVAVQATYGDTKEGVG